MSVRGSFFSVHSLYVSFAFPLFRFLCLSVDFMAIIIILSLDVIRLGSLFSSNADAINGKNGFIKV